MTASTTPEKALDRIGQHDSPAAVADRIGQQTAIEQARAVAEVQAAIVVAQQCPRNLQKARSQILDACSQMALAERAFFRFPRAGGMVTGPSIHLARELARCFGNIDYGIGELRRDDGHGQSEMKAWAWDVENNSRNSNTFIVPHKRDTKSGQATLTDLRDIYENNANNGARRVREAIFAVLPTWLVQEAIEACNKTLADGGGQPLPQRIAKAIDVFGMQGISQSQLEQRLGGRKADDWTPHDVAQLQVIFQSIQRGEVTREDEFPTAAPVTAQEITGKPKAPAGGEAPGFDEVRAQAAGEQPPTEQTGDGGWPEARKPPAEQPEVQDPPYREDQPA